jgi:acyl-CoA synthetase (AMP-forming)/AMP-acid ligase II
MFRTNDLVEIQNGQVLLRGRATDQINVAGRKVSPETIERALGGHPLVRECLAFGVPSPGADRGETIVACLPADPRLSANVLRDYLITRLPAWQMPRDWWFVDSLASNRRGKLSRADWRRRYLEKNTIKA